VPPQAGHFKRINATPSDLPFKSTGFATYPVPPQFGQSSGATPLPLIVEGIVHDARPKVSVNYFALRITNRNPLKAAMFDAVQMPRIPAARNSTTIAFDVGRLLLGATLSSGISTFASGKWVVRAGAGESHKALAGQAASSAILPFLPWPSFRKWLVMSRISAFRAILLPIVWIHPHDPPTMNDTSVAIIEPRSVFAVRERRRETPPSRGPRDTPRTLR
jgi:hypothetical protein